MKITKNELREIILQEVHELMPSEFNPSQVLNRFETNVFSTHVNAILSNMDQMVKEISENDGLTRKNLVFAKEKILDDIFQKASYVEDVLNARLRQKDEG